MPRDLKEKDGPKRSATRGGRMEVCTTGNQNLGSLVEVYAAVLEFVLVAETFKLVRQPDDQGGGGKVSVGNHVCKSAFISLRVSAYARMCGIMVSWASDQTKRHPVPVNLGGSGLRSSTAFCIPHKEYCQLAVDRRSVPRARPTPSSWRNGRHISGARPSRFVRRPRSTGKLLECLGMALETEHSVRGATRTNPPSSKARCNRATRLQ